MIAFCEECGQKHDVDTREVKGDIFLLVCSSCHDVTRITVTKDANTDGAAKGSNIVKPLA